MHGRLMQLSLLIVLGGSGLVLLAQPDTVDDLDRLTPAQLELEIVDEVDDLFNELGMNPNGVYADDQLEEAILDALSDEGDDDTESDLEYDDLEQEMEEAGTTVQKVVAEAIQEADRISYRQESSSSTVLLARSTRDTPSFKLVNVGLPLLAQDKNARAGTAACGVARSLVRRALPQKMPYRSNCRF